MRFWAFILSLLLSVPAILPHSDFCELRKLPALFAHYQEHKDQDGDSFLEFLLEDYLTDKGDKEGHHHSSSPENLPFHGHTSHTHCCNFNLVSNGIAIPGMPQPEVTSFVFNTYLYSCLYSNSIFQPPKA